MIAKLAAVLDLMLPGGDGFPAASDIGLADWLAGRPEFAGAVQDVLALCPDVPNETALAAAERTAPTEFGRLQVGAYSGYYTHPKVLAVIERETGYSARPPQPDGYILPPFDMALLARVAANPPSYRETDDVAP